MRVPSSSQQIRHIHAKVLPYCAHEPPVDLDFQPLGNKNIVTIATPPICRIVRPWSYAPLTSGDRFLVTVASLILGCCLFALDSTEPAWASARRASSWCLGKRSIEAHLSRACNSPMPLCDTTQVVHGGSGFRQRPPKPPSLVDFPGRRRQTILPSQFSPYASDCFPAAPSIPAP
jgi:hypothetical protein